MKGQFNINSRILEYILAGIVGLLVLTAAFVLIDRIRDKNKESLLTELEEDVRSSIQVIASRVGSVTKSSFALPDDVSSICFVDRSKSLVVLTTTLVETYPFIRDIVDSSSEDNVFLITEQGVSFSFHGGPICFDTYPFYKCSDAPNVILDVFFEGKGQCATLTINATDLVSDNERSAALYATADMFLVPEGDGHETWRDIARIVPLALFNDKEDGVTILPFTAYHNTSAFDDSDIVTIMDAHNVDQAVIFRGKPFNFYAIDPLHDVTDQEFANYFQYWDVINEVTVMDIDDEAAALTAGLFAGFVNTPLILLDDTNCNTVYINQILDKKVNIINKEKLDPAARSCVEGNAADVEYYDSSTLRVAFPGFTDLFSHPFPGS